MSKKKHGNWYGRPNAPPKNWHTPDKPAIRSVTGWLDDEPDSPTPTNSDFIIVSLTNEHWIAILQALQLFGQARGDEDWQKWRLSVRSSILGVVNANRDDAQPVAVKLTIEDWRLIWQYVYAVCEEKGKEWAVWFDWLSDVMTKQIKSA